MIKPYYNDIYEILSDKGEDGLPVGIIARQIYNRHAGLFRHDITYDRIYHYVRFVLWTESQKISSPFARGKHRGWYALRENISKQMLLPFTDNENNVTAEKESFKKEKEKEKDTEKEKDNGIDYPTLF